MVLRLALENVSEPAIESKLMQPCIMLGSDCLPAFGSAPAVSEASANGSKIHFRIFFFSCYGKKLDFLEQKAP